MNAAFEIGGIGLESQQKALDVIANNIANINTPSFKRSDVQFSELVTQVSDPDNPPANLSSDPALAGVMARSVLALDQQGEIERTGQTLDLAIDGAGFIELMGARGQTLLWRGGRVSINEDGLLATNDGAPLRANISVPDDVTALQIAADGLVSARTAGSEATTELGRIMLVRPEANGDVERLDGGIYRLADGADVQEIAAGESGVGALVQGAIEHSNVDINAEMIRLMLVQRAYTANAQVLQAADQMMGIANTLRR